jgi:transposase
MRYELSDYEWSVIKPMLPNKPRGVPRVDDRPCPQWHLLGLAIRCAMA